MYVILAVVLPGICMITGLGTIAGFDEVAVIVNTCDSSNPGLMPVIVNTKGFAFSAMDFSTGGFVMNGASFTGLTVT